jgi:hypothetical protein
MNRDVRQERISDPVLAAAFAELRSDLPDADQLETLRRSINRRAELLLARKRTRWYGVVPRPLIPIAMAASIAFALWVGPGLVSELGIPGEPAAFVAQTEEEAILLEALGSDLTEQEFRLLVTGRANPEALLAFAIGSR